MDSEQAKQHPVPSEFTKPSLSGFDSRGQLKFILRRQEHKLPHKCNRAIQTKTRGSYLVLFLLFKGMFRFGIRFPLQYYFPRISPYFVL